MRDNNSNITLLLNRWRNGDENSGSEVIERVYSELKIIASAYLKREKEAAFQTIDLVNEAYVRLVNTQRPEFLNRSHFYGVAARAMRQILIEQVRKSQTKRRAGVLQDLNVEQGSVASFGHSVDYIRLDEALLKLERFDQRKSKLVELRYFGGLSIEETAAFLEISVSTVKREWLLAKAWLYKQLNG